MPVPQDPEVVGDAFLTTKALIAGLIGAAIAAGGVVAVDQGQLQIVQDSLIQEKVSKQAVLDLYVYDQARLGEVPTLDLTTVSADEMSQAYVEVTQSKNTDLPDKDLFVDLQVQAIKDGMECQK